MIRITWNINGRTGHGAWHDPSQRNMLQSWVDDGNGKYGPYTHRIHQSAPADDSSVAEIEYKEESATG